MPAVPSWKLGGGGEECLFLMSWNRNVHYKCVSLQPKWTYYRIFFLSPKKVHRDHSPSIPWGLWNDTLPARVSPASQLEVWWGCQYRCLGSAWVFPTRYKLIHPLAVIQCSASTCWLVDWRKPVILNSGEEAERDQTHPPFSHQPLCPETLQWFRAVCP